MNSEYFTPPPASSQVSPKVPCIHYIYCPSRDAGFFAASPKNAPVDTIFYFEALCVVSALVWATELLSAPHRILIHTDSLNTVEMFHSLKASKGYNDLLLFATHLMMDSHTSLHVFHIDGVNNTVADTLS